MIGRVLKDVLPEGGGAGVGGGANDLPDRRTCLREVRCRISLSGLGVGRNHIFADVFEST